MSNLKPTRCYERRTIKDEPYLAVAVSYVMMSYPQAKSRTVSDTLQGASTTQQAN